MNFRLKHNGTKLILAAISLIIALLIAGGSFAVYCYQKNVCFESDTLSMIGYNKDVSMNLERKVEFLQEMTYIIKQRCYIRMEMILQNLLQLTAEELETLKNIDYQGDEIEFYKLSSSLQVIKERVENPLTLTDEQLLQLVVQGRFEDDEKCYLSYQAQDSWWVLAMEADYSALGDVEYDLSKLYAYVIWNNQTGKVYARGNSELNQRLQDLEMDDFTENILKTDKEYTVSLVKYGGDQYLAVYRSLTISGEDVTVCIFTDNASTNSKVLFAAISFAVLSASFVICCVGIIVYLQKKCFAGIPNYSGKLLLPDNLRRKIQKMFAIISLMFIIVSSVLFTIQNVLQINSDITQIFDNLCLMEESSEHNQETVYSYSRKVFTQYAKDLVDSLEYNYQTDMNEWLKKRAEISKLDEITLFDENGVIEYSTTPYIGYRLTENESDPEYKLWQILKGGEKELLFYDEKTELVYLAIRRTDQVGILLIASKGDTLSSLIEKAEYADLFKLQDYPETVKLYSNREDTKTLYILESGSTTTKTITNNLPLPDAGKMVIGVCNIDGQNYLYVDMGNEDSITIIAYPVQKIFTNSLIFVGMSAAIYLLMNVLYSIFYKKLCITNLPEGMNTEMFEHVFTEEKVKGYQMVVSLLSIVSIISVITGNNVCGGTTLFTFMEYWEKGFNMISVFFTVLSGIICQGIVTLNLLIRSYAEKILRRKGVTIIILVTTIVNLLLFVVFLVMALERFGVNTIAIASSLGLAGLSVSLGSKEMVENIIAGISIAFEGRLQLGDYVDIGGFTGEIVSLGLINTKIKMNNKEQIINNSSMKNVTNYSRGKSTFDFVIYFPFTTDVDEINRLVDDNKQRFIDACDGKMQGSLKFSGISEYKEEKIECKFMGFANPKECGYCSTHCKTELFKILNEHDKQIFDDPTVISIQAEHNELQRTVKR